MVPLLEQHEKVLPLALSMQTGNAESLVPSGSVAQRITFQRKEYVQLALNLSLEKLTQEILQ